MCATRSFRLTFWLLLICSLLSVIQESTVRLLVRASFTRAGSTMPSKSSWLASATSGAWLRAREVKFPTALLFIDCLLIRQPHSAEDDALINLFMEGLEFVNGGPAGADPAFRIEKYLISWVREFEFSAATNQLTGAF